MRILLAYVAARSVTRSSSADSKAQTAGSMERKAISLQYVGAAMATTGIGSSRPATKAKVKAKAIRTAYVADELVTQRMNADSKMQNAQLVASKATYKQYADRSMRTLYKSRRGRCKSPRAT